MNKFALGIALLAVTFFAACKKEETPVTPAPKATPVGSKSYIRITYNEKTIEARDTIVTDFLDYGTFYPMLAKFETKQSALNPERTDKTISLNSIGAGLLHNGKMKIVISASTFGSASTSAVDSFYTANNSPVAFYFDDMTGDEMETYYISRGSTVYIDKWDDELTEGRLKLMIKGKDGIEIPATGEFKIYKK